MKKFSFVLAAVAVTGLTVTAYALPETTLFFDIRDNSAGVQSITTPANPFLIGQGDFPNDGGAGGGKGNGQVLRLMPTISNNLHLHASAPAGTNYYPNFDADNNAATGSLNLYADVGDDAGAVGAGDVISSIGVDIGITAPATTGVRYSIASSAWSWTITDPSSPVNYGFSSGTAVNGGIGGHTGLKYVKVPVDGASLYATAGGLTPGSLTRIGRLAVTAAPRTCNFTGANTHANESTYNVFLSVNNLLITRTFSNVVADTEERVSFGYFGGAVDADVSGNTVGGAGNRDAIIQVRMKNDANGSGNVTTADITFAGNGFTPSQSAGAGITQLQRYLHDRNNSGTVTTADIAGFTASQASPCP